MRFCDKSEFNVAKPIAQKCGQAILFLMNCAWNRIITNIHIFLFFDIYGNTQGHLNKRMILYLVE